MKRGAPHPGPVKTEPWESDWIELIGTTTWRTSFDKLVRIQDVVTKKGKLRKVIIGRLEILPDALPYPTLEPGMYITVVGQVGTLFKMIGKQIVEPKT